MPRAGQIDFGVGAMSRLAGKVPESLTEQQRGLFDAIVGGRRAGRASGSLVDDAGALSGPFNALLAAPEVGMCVHELGEAIRFGMKLPDQLLEIAVLVTARTWRAEFEGWAHSRLALAAGLPDVLINAVLDGRRPAFEDDGAVEFLDDPAGSAVVYDAAVELLETHRWSDATYGLVEQAIGEQQLAELTLLLGYYGLISMVLNVFDVVPPSAVFENR